MNETSTLALRTTVHELVAAFERAERDVRAAFAQIVAAEQAVNLAFGITESWPSIRVSATGTRYDDDFKNVERTIEIMTRAAWRSIVERLELRRFMSIKRWEELEKQLHGEERGGPKLPPITLDNVVAFAEGHYQQAPAMLTEAVREVFEWLRPREHDSVHKLKTNTEMEVGERAIVSGMITSGYTASGLQVRADSFSRCSQQLVALENVFNALAGRGTIAKSYRSALEDAISKVAEGETDLFAYRACKNGHLHLRFKRLDLLARFNAMAGGKNLKPAEGEDEKLRRELAEQRALNERLRREAARRGAVA